VASSVQFPLVCGVASREREANVTLQLQQGGDLSARHELGISRLFGCWPVTSGPFLLPLVPVALIPGVNDFMILHIALQRLPPNRTNFPVEPHPPDEYA
jgi:hypothetical protein